MARIAGAATMRSRLHPVVGTVTVLAGGVGAARLLGGLVQVMDPALITAVVNVGDDLELHGLFISPDLDTITYTLAGAINPETGWGLAGETWQAMDSLQRYGGATWFRLGDRDLGTHLYRTGRRWEGATLSQITAEIASAWGLRLRLLPVSDDAVRTHLQVVDDPVGAPEGVEVSFQEYFVRRHHDVPVRGIRFAGVDTAKAAPGVLEAIIDAEQVVIAPSNPIVSIGPLFAVPGVHGAVKARRERVVAVSPIVAGAALKGPADRLMAELGEEASVVGVARLYREVAGTLVIDEADAALAPAVEAEGVRCVVAPTVMRDAGAAAALGRVVLGALGRAAHRGPA
jgi:LPPG:FO 2-phospho-L-lactate transferase